ncbi:MAG: Z-ring formation inhibitor MciZ [Bacillaceae bacterium]|nr:Z-ring formation inhibitor MciZ [Bacillaceae bacterium]
MKAYYHFNQLRLVGKGWEIKNKLREWARHPMTLKSFLDQRVPRP